MTTDEAIAAMKAARYITYEGSKSIDKEAVHFEADHILLKWIESNGGEKVRAAYDELQEVVDGFWYA